MEDGARKIREMKHILRDLGLRRDWVYEVIVATYSGGKENSAPMGVYTEDFRYINLVVYKTSGTCRNILNKKEFTVNFPDKILLFYKTVFKEDLGYKRAGKVDAPILKDADAYLEMRVKEVRDMGDKVLFKAEVVDSCLNREGRKVNLVNRGDALALECLIKATRIPYVPEDERSVLKKEITCISQVVRKVAPGSVAVSLVAKIHSLIR